LQSVEIVERRADRRLDRVELFLREIAGTHSRQRNAR
jgi:hypothetical protein